MMEVPLPDRQLGLEWMLLELLCPGSLEGPRLELFQHTLETAQIDFPELVEQAMRHRLLPLLAYTLADESLADVVLPQLRTEVLFALIANRRRLALHTRAAVEITQRLREAGVPVAATKGIVLEPTVYGGVGVRRMNDVDLVVHPSHRADAARLMSELGFVNGVYNWRKHQIDDLPARVRALYRLSPDHLPLYMRLEEDTGEVTAVDFANSLTWTASEWQLDMTEVLTDCQDVSALAGSATLPGLRPAYLFLSVTLHLFRESWFTETIERGKDALYKYADVLRIWGAYGEQLATELPGLIDRYELGRPVGWVLAHTDRIFGTGLTAALGLEQAISEEWLASAYGRGGEPLTWNGSMRERLYARDRAALFHPREMPAGDR